MKVTAKLDGSTYPVEAINAKGFVLEVGDYNAPMRATLKLDFAEGIELMRQLVAAAKEHNIAVSERMKETGRLALLSDALAEADAL